MSDKPEQIWIVSEDDAGKRLDVFATEHMPRLSRAFIKKLAEQGKVTVDNTKVKAGYKLKEAQTITVDYDQAELDVVPHIDLPIIYEDDDCVVINKPAGVLTHAQGNLSTEATVATFLRDKLKDLEGARGGIVHRLDRATSGVIICAKNQEALSFLQKQFSQRKAKKTYMAIVAGQLNPKAAVIDMPIERNPKAPATFRVGANGKPSTTTYTVITETPAYSLVELKPTTGRTHQLRVHLAEQGHPIEGDPLYGTGAFGDRLYLHALSLEITLPNRERRTFEAPLPPEFAQFMEQDHV
jgi:23S rRNA pseudouridine1911/1915/1917 synthase